MGMITFRLSSADMPLGKAGLPDYDTSIQFLRQEERIYLMRIITIAVTLVTLTVLTGGAVAAEGDISK